MNSNEVIVLHSGGIDSTALINFFLKLKAQVTSLHIQYGQASFKKEASSVKKICRHYNIPNMKVNLKTDKLFKDGYIQGRNLFLLSVALLSSTFEKGQIAIGIHDGTDYNDCGPDFLNLTNAIFKLYTNGQVMVSAPFIKWNKKQIHKYCIQELVPIELTYSCELGLNQPCGICPSCKELIILNGSKIK